MTQPETPTRTEFNQAAQRCAAAYHQVKAQLPKGAFSWSTEGEENQHKAFLAFAAELPLLIDPPSFQLYLTCIGQGVTIGAIDPVDAGRFCHIANTAISTWKLANLIVPAAQAKERAAEEKARLSSAGRESDTPLPSKSNQSGVESSSQAGESVPQAPKGENQAAPLPPKGNQSEEKVSQSEPRQSQSDPQQPPKGENQAAPLPSKGNHAHEETIPFEDWEDIYAATKLPDWNTQAQLFKTLRDRNIDIPTDEELRAHPADALRCCETARYFENCQQPAAAPPSPSPAKEQPAAQKEVPAHAA